MMRLAPMLGGALMLGGCFLLPSPQPYSGPTPEALDPARFVGCYQATFHAVREWRPDNHWQLRLDSAAANSRKPGGGNGLPARRATASIQRQDDPYWKLIPGGIQLHIGDSLHGLVVDFEERNGGLVGRVFYYSDTVRGYQTERVSAHKVPCEGESAPR